MRRLSLSLLWLLLLLPTLTHSETQLALSLTITQTRVEMKRAGTEAWLALPTGAVTPFGVGDQLRTDFTGRAYFQLEGLEQVLLPNSTYELTALESTATGEWRWHARLSGRLANRVAEDITFADLQLETDELVVTAAQGDFLIEHLPDETPYVVAAQGEVTLISQDQTITLPEQHGVRLSDPISPVTAIQAASINPARIEGELEGCDGEIQSQNDVDVRVRAGPSEQFFYMGSILDSTAIKLVGFASMQDGLWYRFQFLSDFGWVTGSVIQTTCQNLPQLSPRGVENAPGIINWQDFEVAILKPFFATPAEDVWFYRY